jgi:hypothetical protein
MEIVRCPFRKCNISHTKNKKFSSSGLKISRPSSLTEPHTDNGLRTIWTASLKLMFNKNPPALPFPPIFISTYFIMPYSINKLARGSYEVVNSKTGKIHAKHTSLAKAKAQVRLLGMKDGMKGGLHPSLVPVFDTLAKRIRPNAEQLHRIFQRIRQMEDGGTKVGFFTLEKIFNEEVPPLFQSKGRLNPQHQPRDLTDATTGHSSDESDDSSTVSSLTSSGRGRRVGGIRLTPQVRDIITQLYPQYRPNIEQLKNVIANVHLLDERAIANDLSDLPQMIEACFRVAMGIESNVPLSSIPFTKEGKGRMTGGLDIEDHDVKMWYQRLFLQYSPNPAQTAIIREAIEALPPEALAEGGSDLPEMIEACFKVGMDIDDGDPPAGKPSGKGYSGGATYGEKVLNSRGNSVVVPPNYNHGSLPFF